MARPSNNFESVSLTIAITPQMRVYLEDLTMKGTHGCSPAEAARMVLSRAIEDMINKGDLEKRKFVIQDGDVVALPTAA
ncbi:MAG TPA: hypothetical protein VD994_06210 [Prosthecobacter sp.]|nr:hypothetical protein [Prosthecobacter sp.]